MKRVLWAALAGLTLMAGAASAADKFELTVEGNLEGGVKVVLSGDDVAKLPVTRFKTDTPWTPKSEFIGVRILDVLAHVKAGKDAKEVVTKTIDGYSVAIPIEQVRKYPVILAYRINGERLTVANKGPYWVMYPLDDFPELKTNLTNERSAWALKGLIVK